MFLMWGYEGEELEDIAATVEHVKASNPDVFFTTVSYPIKGTGYFDKVRDTRCAADRLGRRRPTATTSSPGVAARTTTSSPTSGCATKSRRSGCEATRIRCARPSCTRSRGTHATRSAPDPS